MIFSRNATLRFFTFILLIISLGCASGNKDKEGFKLIFDGKNLEKWDGDPNYWRVEDGKLVGEITPDKLLKMNSFITWQGGQPGDFELKASYRITDEGNSGINYRSELVSDTPFALRGYQADIDGENRYTGQNYEERKRTTLAFRGEVVIPHTQENHSNPESLRENVKHNTWQLRTIVRKLDFSEKEISDRSDNDWNEMHIIAKGNRLQHFVNGILMSEVIDEDTINRSNKGYIGVQVHVGPPMKVEYKDIRIKQLD